MNPVVARRLKNVSADLIGRPVGIFSKAPRRFVIFTNGRTGSNLLVSLLRAHPHFRVHSEVFGEHQIDVKGIRRMIARRGPVRYLDRCFRRMTIERYVGIKMLYYNVEENYGVKRGVPGLSALKPVILSDPDMMFIHLKRKNHVNRLISNALAQASGQFLNGSYLDEQIRVDLDWAESELQRMRRWECEFDAELPADRTFELTYEDLIQDRAKAMSELFDFFDADQIPVTSPMKKQGKRPHCESIKNYDELKSRFAKTEFAPMFE